MAEDILVIAPTSLTGSRFIELSKEKFRFMGAGMRDSLTDSMPLANFMDLDVTSDDQVKRVIEGFPGKYIINFAGATAVGDIEKTRPENPDDISQLEQNLAYRINVMGTSNILNASIESGKTPIFISTDFVFDGKNGPYSEDDVIAQNPSDLSWYAWTKVLAEKVVAAQDAKSITVRISYPYRSDFELKGDIARNFLKKYDQYKNGEIDSLNPAFTDQIFTPTFIDDLADSISLLIDKEEMGIYNLASPHVTSFYDFFCYLLQVARGVEDPSRIISKGSIDDYIKNNPQSPKWPKNGGLRSDKITKLGFTPTDWKDGIKEAFAQ